MLASGNGTAAAADSELHSDQSTSFLLLRAVTKDLLLNALGLALAFAAESQHRANFNRAKQFLEEEEAM